MPPPLDPSDPRFPAWIATLSAEDELIVRLALRNHFRHLRGDTEWSARVSKLTAELKPSERKMAHFISEASRIERAITQTKPPKRRAWQKR
jgi:hypothetical protein